MTGRSALVKVAPEAGFPVVVAACSDDVRSALGRLSGNDLTAAAELAARAGGFLVSSPLDGKPVGIVETDGEAYVIGRRADGASRVGRVDSTREWEQKAVATAWAVGLAAGAITFRLKGAEAWLLAVIGSRYEVDQAEEWPLPYDRIGEVRIPGRRPARAPLFENSTAREETRDDAHEGRDR